MQNPEHYSSHLPQVTKVRRDTSLFEKTYGCAFHLENNALARSGA
jgi:hypothetical protein